MKNKIANVLFLLLNASLIVSMERPQARNQAKIVISSIDNQDSSYYAVTEKLQADKDDYNIKPRDTSILNKQIIFDNSRKAILYLTSKPHTYDLALQVYNEPENKVIKFLLGYFENGNFSQLIHQDQIKLSNNPTENFENILINLLIHGDESKVIIIKQRRDAQIPTKKKSLKFWKK